MQRIRENYSNCLYDTYSHCCKTQLGEKSPHCFCSKSHHHYHYYMRGAFIVVIPIFTLCEGALVHRAGESNPFFLRRITLRFRSRFGRIAHVWFGLSVFLWRKEVCGLKVFLDHRYFSACFPLGDALRL